jgi:hypothetical protein
LAYALAPGLDAPDELAFAPEQGLVLEKRGSFEGEVELEEFSVMVNGSAVDAPKPSVQNTFDGTMVVTDTYAEIADGRVTKLLRRFDDLAQHQASTVNDSQDERDVESPLEGATVAFTWDSDAGSYSVAFEGEEERDEDLLEGLEASLDFEVLLPTNEVAVDDTWSVESRELREVLSMGGEMHFESEDSPQEELFDEAMKEKLEGSVTCTYRGMRDVDGRSLAVIEIELSGEGRAEAEETQQSGQVEVTVQRTADAGIDLKGELLWDAAAGHFQSFEASGEIRFTLEEDGTMEVGGETQEQSVTMSFAGDLKLMAEAGAPE